MSEPQAWPSPAKLNLFLHITGRRADGYHELQTVFQFLDHGDEIFIAPRHDGVITRAAALPGIDEADDLSLKAARLLQPRAARGAGCEIRVDKKLPTGAGLGGGSSNAATVLVALNLLWELKLGEDELAALGLKLGADVPVFVRGSAAWAEGIGEKLTPIAPPEPWYLVVTPPCHVNTKEMYAAPQLRRNTPRVTPPDWIVDRARIGNDFEPVVRARYPEVAYALDRLAALAPRARLSGSGASVFAAFPDRAAAEAAASQLGLPGSHFVARGLNRSPLRAAVEAYNSRR